MAYFMIFFSIALIIGSWMWISPSPQQKRLARLRQRALLDGFRAKFISHEQYKKLVGKSYARQKPEEQQIVRYGFQSKRQGLSRLPSVNFLLILDSSGALIEFQDKGEAGQTTPSYQEELAQLAQELATSFEGLLALEFMSLQGNLLINLYWQELGNLDEIDFKQPALTRLTGEPETFIKKA
jgi:hypothetical protein